MQTAGEITQLLQQWSQGDEASRDALYPLVYHELKRIAGARLALEGPNPTLQATSLVHELFIRMENAGRVHWNDHAHFVAFSARLMRQILVDHGRRRHALRRDGCQQVTLSLHEPSSEEDLVDLMALDAALSELEQLNPGHARIVELRYFGGLTIEETAAAMDISLATVKRGWRAARAWLYQALDDSGQPADEHA